MLDDTRTSAEGDLGAKSRIGGSRRPDGERPVAHQVESCLLQELSVEACAVLARRSEAGEDALTAYIVTSGPFAPERLDAWLRDRLPATALPSAYVPISSLPLTAAGDVDEAALLALPVVEELSRRRWEDGLGALPGVERVAVVVEERVRPVPVLHRSDLLPDWPLAPAGGGADDEPSPRRAVDVAAADEPPALSDGGPLVIPEGAPRTFGEAILRVATERPAQGTTFVEADGRETFRGFAQQLDDARRLLAGLRAKGLRAGDVVILQIDALGDYCTALWACILGGVSPATVAVAPTYDAANGVAAKLINAWTLLDHPVIIASSHLAEPITRHGEALGLRDLTVLGLDALRGFPAADALHRGDPDDVLFYQLTSGSTGASKCIPETHRAVIAHVHAVQQFNGYAPDDVVLNWLPMDHVGALLMFYLRSLYLGNRQVLVKPDVVLAEPLRWLDLLEHHRATNTWSPNFGYKLVADRLASAGDRRWDLSAMRLFLNGGEQVTLPVVRDFLSRVAPFGVPERAMQPAFGMAETCTGMTYENQFALATGACRIDAAADGRVALDADEAVATTLVPVGRPIPGVQMRIVDPLNRLLPECVIGRLQIKGAVVFGGYLRNDEANAEAMVGDGWFNTGDLGFLRDGALVLTGREKETIVVRGANFYCHEIEELIDAVDGVEPTFAGACAVHDPATGTEGCAVFFVPRGAPAGPLAIDEPLARLVQAVRAAVAKGLGISPTYVIPLPREAFPKTTSGKIQRLQLKRGLEEGQFRETIKALDLLLENANTLPAWFYRKVWRRKQLLHPAPVVGATLVLADELGLGVALARRLEAAGAVIIAEAGAGFERLGPAQFRLDPADPAGYRRLLGCLAAEGVALAQVVHLWTYQADAPGPAADDLEQGQRLGALSALALLAALAERQQGDGALRLLAASSPVQMVRPTDRVNVAQSPLLGVLKTAGQELAWLDCRHVDLPLDEVEANAARLLPELGAADRDVEVAYRGGERLICRLERADLVRESPRPLPFKPGGAYLITGGLGGIAGHIARFLLRHYQAKLLLVGRTPLAERGDEEGVAAERAGAYRALAGLGGEVAYAAVDVADAAALGRAVAGATSNWGQELDGVIHLAGAFTERPLVEETAETFLATLRPKVAGAWTLHELVKERPDCCFITFSSANGYFGGYGVGAYAAANAFLDNFALYRRWQCGLPSIALAWSLWDEVGMSRGYGLKALSRASGFAAVSADEGLASFLAASQGADAHLLIGLDERRGRIQHRLEAPVEERLALRAYYAPDAPLAPDRLRALAVRDRFGRPIGCAVAPMRELPLTETGAIDRDRLSALTARPAAEEQSDLERQLVHMWRDLLGVPSVGRTESFFALGGNSLLAAQVVSRVRQTCAVEITPHAFFAAPTVAQLAAEIERRRAADQDAALAPLPRVDRGGPLPLSLAQQRLWFLDQLAPGSAAYHIASAVRLRGRLDVAALERSLSEIVRRHEALRTAFRATGGEPYQVIVPPMAVTVNVADLRDTPDSERDAEVGRLVRQEARQPFDLRQPPLLRARLLRLAAEDHVLVLTVHHIVFDGWSVGVFRRELAALYEAFAEGRPSPLPTLAAQYADYAAWQREWLAGDTLQRQLAFWKAHLADVATLELPVDRPRQGAAPDQGAIYRFRIDAERTAALRELGERAGATLFMTLLAAFQVVLARYSGQDDIVVGSPLAGRARPELERLIGFFVNMLPLRADLSGDPTFAEALARVRRAALDAYAHQDAPFDALVDELQPERRLSANPIFQVVFALQNAPMGTLALHGLTIEPLEVHSGTAKFDLFLEITEAEGGLAASIEYRADRFEAETIERLASHYTTLLRGVVADPWRRLSALPLLSAAEAAQLAAWNQTARPYPRERGLAALFAAQVARAPGAVAVEAGEERLSYAELDRRAERLARRLRGHGVGPDVLVGVALERSLEWVVALAAVTKAGGAYLPLDLGAPPARLATMLADAQAPVVVTRAGLLGRLPATGAQVICLDGAEPDPAAGEPDPAGGRSGPGRLAYAIYTSGSTGRPKAVAVEQRAVARLVCNSDYVRLGPGDRVAHLSNVAFDAATFEVWGALLNGGCLVILSQEVVLAPGAFAAALRERRITALFLTTSLFNQTATLAPAAFGVVGCVLVGGEAMDPRPVRQVLAAAPPGRLLNVYGPTETTTFATWSPVATVPPDAATLPIGRPIANSTAQVLGRRGELLPVGVAGELYLGGDGVARGYLGRPGLTAERFTPDPFSAEPGARRYRTGDRARWRPDGQLEYLGRLDRQVKLRGFRIELGEIEAALRALPGVAQAAAALREDRPGEKRLVAYLVPERPAPREGAFAGVGAAGSLNGAGAALPSEPREQAVSLSGLQRALKERLPDYMLPSAYLFLDALPLTPNGKLDRRALPAPQTGRPELETAYEAPRSELERRIVAIWCDVLQLNTVGRHDNFFDLGGRSLLLTQVYSRLLEAGERAVSITDLFQFPTVSALARHLSGGPGEPAADGDVEQRALDRRQALARRQRAQVRNGGA